MRTRATTATSFAALYRMKTSIATVSLNRISMKLHQTSVRNLYFDSAKRRGTTRKSRRNVMLIVVIEFGWNGVLTRLDNILTSIMYTSATRSRRCAYNYISAHVQVQIETFRGKRCNKLQLSTIDLFTGQREHLPFGRFRIHGSWKFYIAPIYSRHFEAVHLATERVPTLLEMVIDNRHLLFVPYKRMSLNSLPRLTGVRWTTDK